MPKLGPKAYEQCAGFLRIHDGDNPLDDTSVHPESYEAAMKLLDKMGLDHGGCAYRTEAGSPADEYGSETCSEAE